MVLEGSSKLVEEFFDIHGRESYNSWGPFDWYGRCDVSFSSPWSARLAQTDSDSVSPQASPMNSKNGSSSGVASGSRSAPNLGTSSCGILGRCTTTSARRETGIVSALVRGVVCRLIFW
jgi:hypothetical protein